MFYQWISQKSKLIQQIATYLAVVLAVLTLGGIIFSPYIPAHIQWKVGEKATATIVSPRYVQFESAQDQQKTEELRQKRRSFIEPVYSIDENINKTIKSDIISFFTVLKEYKNNLVVNPTTKIPTELEFLTPHQLSILLKDININSTEYLSIQNAQSLLNEGLKEIDQETLQTKLEDNIKILALGKKQEEMIVALVLHFIQPNQIYDKQKTDQQIDLELESIQPFTTTLKEGQPIIYKGEIVTNAHIDILKQLNMYGLKTNFFKLLGIICITFLLLILIERTIFFFYPEKAQIKYYTLIFSIILIVILLSRLLLVGINLQKSGMIQFLIPVSISSMLISLFITSHLALLIGVVISILVAIMYQSDFYLLMFLFLSVAVSTFAIYEKHKRSEFIKAGYIIGIGNILIIIAIGLYKEVNAPLWFLINSFLGMMNGILSSMISLAIFPYLESLFKITTAQSLLEQTNLNHPLLKRLMMSAPGTYQHSLMVANLAETVAQAIQANPILAKTGAYFHDIGKLKRPIFYIENQFGIENPHKALTPRMSKLIIQAHIKEGLELADKYHIPQAVKDIIQEHHGTSLVSFFYSQAMQTEEAKDSEAVIKEDFRYPGPKPKSKESAIVMLADNLEAAMRSMEKPSLAKIESLISKILKEKMDDGQLDECPLNLNEIELIRKAFIEFFKGIYHSRLDYEEEVAQIIGNEPQNGKGTTEPSKGQKEKKETEIS